MGRDSAVLSSLESSLHHCGLRTEKSLDRDEGSQGPQSDSMANHAAAKEHTGWTRVWGLIMALR